MNNNKPSSHGTAITIIFLVAGCILTLKAIFGSLIWAGLIQVETPKNTSSYSAPSGYVSTPNSSSSSTSAPQLNYNYTKTITNYQEIYNEYSQKLINSGPTSSVNEMANILNEGLEKMATYMYSASGVEGQYSTYESWGNKLIEVYLNNCR